MKITKSLEAWRLGRTKDGWDVSFIGLELYVSLSDVELNGNAIELGKHYQVTVEIEGVGANESGEVVNHKKPFLNFWPFVSKEAAQ